MQDTSWGVRRTPPWAPREGAGPGGPVRTLQRCRATCCGGRWAVGGRGSRTPRVKRSRRAWGAARTQRAPAARASAGSADRPVRNCAPPRPRRRSTALSGLWATMAGLVVSGTQVSPPQRARPGLGTAGWGDRGLPGLPLRPQPGWGACAGGRTERRCLGKTDRFCAAQSLAAWGQTSVPHPHNPALPLVPH